MGLVPGPRPISRQLVSSPPAGEVHAALISRSQTSIDCLLFNKKSSPRTVTSRMWKGWCIRNLNGSRANACCVVISSLLERR